MRAQQCAGLDAGSDHYPAQPEVLEQQGEPLVRAARQRGQPAALLVAHLADLPELQIVFGRRAANRAVEALMALLTRLAGRAGIAVRMSADRFAALVPRSTGEELQAIVDAQLGQACALEFDFDGEELLLVPEVQTGTVSAIDSLAKAYTVLDRTIASRLYLAQARGQPFGPAESSSTNSAPVSAGAVQARAVAAQWAAPQPATVPVPMGSR